MNLNDYELGRYKIKDLLGKGGMAEVYLGWDKHLRRWVAIKILSPDLMKNPIMVKRFWREAWATARLQHNNIITIHDICHDNGLYYIVMEYVNGISLAKYIRKKGPLSPNKTIALLQPIADALDYAHQHKMLHRDIKPGNILLDQKKRPIVTDFGIVKFLGNHSGPVLTRTLATIGTPTYMSPEQIQGLKLTPAADVYSLAIMTYQMLTGYPPFTGDTASIINSHLYCKPNLAPITPALRPILERALHKDHTQRYKTATKFIQKLKWKISPSGKITTTRIYSRPNKRNVISTEWLWIGSSIIIITVLFFIVNSMDTGSSRSKQSNIPSATPEATVAVVVVLPTVTFVPTHTPFPTATRILVATFTRIVATATASGPNGTPTSSASQSRISARELPGFNALTKHLMLPPASESISPHGGKIAITEGIKLYTVSSDGSTLDIWLEEDETIRPVEGAVWSPDGKYIAFIADYKQNCNPCRVVGVVRLADGALYFIKDSLNSGLATDSPRWTQDGRLLVNLHPTNSTRGTTYIYDQSRRGTVAVGRYILSSSHEGQKWTPWLPGRIWTTGVGSSDGYYNN